MNRIKHKQTLTIEKINELRNFINRQRYISLLYLFGSYAKGKQGRLSDVDIAFYFKPNINKKEFFKKELSLRAELGKILKTDKLIDVIIMNEAPITLNFEIIKGGRLIFERNRDFRIDVETRIMSEYLDRIYYDKRHLNYFLKKIKSKGLIKI